MKRLKHSPHKATLELTPHELHLANALDSGMPYIA